MTDGLVNKIVNKLQKVLILSGKKCINLRREQTKIKAKLIKINYSNETI